MPKTSHAARTRQRAARYLRGGIVFCNPSAVHESFRPGAAHRLACRLSAARMPSTRRSDTAPAPLGHRSRASMAPLARRWGATRAPSNSRSGSACRSEADISAFVSVVRSACLLDARKRCSLAAAAGVNLNLIPGPPGARGRPMSVFVLRSAGWWPRRPRQRAYGFPCADQLRQSHAFLQGLPDSEHLAHVSATHRPRPRHG